MPGLSGLAAVPAGRVLNVARMSTHEVRELDGSDGHRCAAFVDQTLGQSQILVVKTDIASS